MVFPWNVADSELEELGLHKHCYTCMNVSRCRNRDDGCDIIECEERCGAKYHQCKDSEHKLLCEKEWIPCPNSQYGCEIEIMRSEIARHLPVCPANIITCTHEWNRWPVFCQEKYKTLPFRRKNPLAKEDDLDLQLAMRDQRMALDFYSVPRKTKLALRNSLTRRYPAVPLPNTTPRKKNVTDKSMKSLQDIFSFEVSDDQVVGPQYGIAKLFLKNQEVQQRRWKEDVDNAIQRTGMPVPKKYWEYDEFEKGNIHKHCSTCYLTTCEREPVYDGIMSCGMATCSFHCGAIFHHCKMFEHQMVCENFEDEGEFDWILRDRKLKSKKVVKIRHLKTFPSLFDPPSEFPVPTLSVPKKKGVPPPPPPPPNHLNRVLGLDMRMDTVTKLQQKPKAMHTFLCAQTFRRDQWESHSKNVHSDIHGGLNNWFVSRCPMSHYGCGFSVNRFYPGTNPGNRVVYSDSTESFGIQPQPPNISYINSNSKPVTNGISHSQPNKSAQNKNLTNGVHETDICYLTELPVELLQMIVRMLDSWTLNQVSLVCRNLREIVSTLLDSRGCVALQWEKTGDGFHYKKKGWEVSYKRWFFSNHFDAVICWGVNADGAVANHLKVCPYNDRVIPRTWDKNSPLTKQLMQDIMARTKIKRESDWFIS